METIGSKRSYALILCTPNNDDDETVVNAALKATGITSKLKKSILFIL